MTEQELSENETLWAEERGDTELAQPDAPSLRGVGLSPGGVQSDIEGLGPDLGTAGPGAPAPSGPGEQGAANAIGVGGPAL